MPTYEDFYYLCTTLKHETPKLKQIHQNERAKIIKQAHCA